MSISLETHIAQWLLLAATVAVAWWGVQYTLSAPWWKDQVGRTIIVKEALLLVLLIPSCLLQVWPNLMTLAEALTLELFVFAGIFAVMVWRSVVWWRIQPPRPRAMWRVLRAAREARHRE